MIKRNYKKKKSNYRRKTYGSKSYRKGSVWGGVASVAKTALKTAKFVAGLVNAEYKVYDINASPVAINDNGTIYGPFCAPSQGLTYAQRSGDSIKLKDLTMRLQIFYAGTTECIRIIIFLDKENSVAAGSDFLQFTGGGNAILSPKNYNNQYKTKTLMDITVKMTSYNPIFKLDKVIPLNMHTRFLSGTTTPETNAIKMLVIGQQSGTGATTCQYFSHSTYVDN
nr:MAG: capsid protein [Cressdnaviricota sp.]